MRVLLVKTSSMGDLIHTFPALTDAGHAIPGIRFDWVVEEAFADIPAWHPLVDKVIPVALRRWRKGVFSKASRDGWLALRRQLHQQDYDLVLDAQGLVKSALVTMLAKGIKAGLDWRSAREMPAALAYQKRYKVNFYQHAVTRMRSLFALALGYTLPDTSPDFAIHREQFGAASIENRYIVFLHGTTWASKQWPLSYWSELATIAGQAGLKVVVTGWSETEVTQAHEIAAGKPHVVVKPRLGLPDMCGLLANANSVVSVDTGLGHLAAALGVPTVSLYGSTNPDFTGALGKQSVHLAADFPCAPCLNRECTYTRPSSVKPACYTTVPPQLVWEKLNGVRPDPIRKSECQA